MIYNAMYFGSIINLTITPLLSDMLYKRIVVLQLGIFGISNIIMSNHTFVPPINCIG